MSKHYAISFLISSGKFWSIAWNNYDDNGESSFLWKKSRYRTWRDHVLRLLSTSSNQTQPIVVIALENICFGSMISWWIKFSRYTQMTFTQQEKTIWYINYPQPNNKLVHERQLWYFAKSNLIKDILGHNGSKKSKDNRRQMSTDIHTYTYTNEGIKKTNDQCDTRTKVVSCTKNGLGCRI